MRWGKLFTRNLRDFPDKVIHDPDFLHLLVVHLLNLADQDFTDKPVQHCLIQFLDGGIAPDFLDEGADFTLWVSARLCIIARSCRRFWLIPALVPAVRLHKPASRSGCLLPYRYTGSKHPVNFLIPLPVTGVLSPSEKRPPDTGAPFGW